MTNKIHPAVKAIIQHGNKFLLIKQALSRKVVWDLPGGKIQYGESPYDTLLREVKEEVQLTIKIIKPVGIFWFFGENHDQVVCTTFLCAINNPKINLFQNPDTSENIIEFRWFTKEEILNDKFEILNISLKNLFTLI